MMTVTHDGADLLGMIVVVWVPCCWLDYDDRLVAMTVLVTSLCNNTLMWWRSGSVGVVLAAV